MEFSTQKGAFYIFLEVKDEKEFVETFETRGRNHVRISYAASFENLKRAFETMNEGSDGEIAVEKGEAKPPNEKIYYVPLGRFDGNRRCC